MPEKIERRGFISRLSLLFGGLLVSPSSVMSNVSDNKQQNMNPIKVIKPLGFQWETQDPFLFCVHHDDKFPKGNEAMGPDKSHFEGRSLGGDFIIKDGFRMYHGKTVPGFPGHPHRGFETITVVRKGVVDHSDSLGAAGRYGNGDVQWMTAGKGVQHAEMFPLIHPDKENPMELFQIWLNLPKKSKMVKPHFKMLWKEDIPNHIVTDDNKKKTKIEVITGAMDTIKSSDVPPDSWASSLSNEVAIWNIKMEAGATWILPKASIGVNRSVYFYEGDVLKVAGQEIDDLSAMEVQADVDLELIATNADTSILVLQGKPIGEPVIQYGPFVMNTKQEIHDAFDEFHKTQFGGWPWPKTDYVHARDKKRFALHADGTLEQKNNL